MRSLSHRYSVSHFKRFVAIFIIIFALVINFIPVKSFAVPEEANKTKISSEENIQKIFSLGRGLGSSYYYMTSLYDQGLYKPYSSIRDEYAKAFQCLNIVDIILSDINTSIDSRMAMENITANFYNSLNDEDLNEVCLFYLRQSFVDFYKNLALEINRDFSPKESWFLALGFYLSFQEESLNSAASSKLLLSGFHKLLNQNILKLPQDVSQNLKMIDSLDKPVLSEQEISDLKLKISDIIEYFDNYRVCKASSIGNKELRGEWSGILIDPGKQKHEIKLVFPDNNKITMDIDGIARNLNISDLKIINKYITFMFKPFGNQKLFIKFNAKIDNNTFTGEAVDALGQKGNWLLSRTEISNKCK